MVNFVLIIVICLILVVTAIAVLILINGISESNKKKNAEHIRIQLNIEAENIKNTLEYIQAVKTAESFCSEITALEQSYIAHSDFLKIQTKYLKTYKYLKSFEGNPYIQLTKESSKLIEIFGNFEKYVTESNNNFVVRELENCRELFNNIDGKSLDDQQRKAVVTDEDNELIIAGAGSGKTLTLSGKVQYLIKRKKVNPEKILLISFTKKATEELAERISKNVKGKVDAKTFHALGLRIITDNSNKQPNVADEWFCKRFVEDYFKNTVINNPHLVTNIMMFFRSYMNIPDCINRYEPVPIHFDTDYPFETLRQEDILSLKKPGSTSKETYCGDHVRSFEELLIANFLYVNGVEYEYEKKYPLSKNDNPKISYNPDFYLTEYDIYLEHFGISREGKVPWLSKFDEEKYLNGIKWKRDFHKKHGTTLIETYSYYRSEGILLNKLRELLVSHGVVLKPINLDKMFMQWRDKKSLSGYTDFINLISNFIILYKSRGFSGTPIESLSTIADSYVNEYYCERTHLFLEIISPIYEDYQRELKSAGSIDFADMINKATEIIESDYSDYDYDYILVDEFQDISYDRYKLINALKSKSGAKIICVGDDWQSIFQYAGSDIGLFTNFEKYFGYSAVMKIEHTYRNSQELIKTAGKFVMTNPKQIKKELISNKSLKDSICVREYSSNISEILMDVVDEIVEKFGKEADILLLGRTKFDLRENMRDELLLGSCFYLKSTKDTEHISCSKYPELNLRFLTVHKAKGLEADNVIILNLENKRLGFPNKIEDDPILDLVLVDSDDYIYAEERRLFYVAMTRTRNYVYLLVPKKEQRRSVFANEIFDTINFQKNKNLKNPKPVEEIKSASDFENYLKTGYVPEYDNKGKPIILCPECGARMVIRHSRYGDFFGCSRYPECKGKRNLKK